VATRASDARDRAALAEIERDGRVVSAGIWLFLMADTFFFAAWWFSFFYLRALNNDSAWTPQGVGPPNQGFGLAVLAMVVLMAGAYWLMSRAPLRSNMFSVLGPVSLVLGIAAVLFQGYGMWHLGFGLTQGGYASVCAGLTGAWLLQLLFAVGWLLTVVVQTRPGGDTVVRRPAATAFGWILVFLAAVGVINYILLYLVH
jgi:heme/copper-type cytochrome/quinol oxidase subunit 3